MGNFISEPLPDEALKHWPPPGGFERETRVQYFSETHGAWVDCTISDVDVEGRVEVSCKRGLWLPFAEQASRLRPAGFVVAGASDSELGGSIGTCGLGGVAAGDVVMYWSNTHCRWVPSRIIGVKPNGEVQIECKQGHWMTANEQACRLRSPGVGLGALEVENQVDVRTPPAPPPPPARVSPRPWPLSETVVAAHNSQLTSQTPPRKGAWGDFNFGNYPRDQSSPCAGSTASPDAGSPVMDPYGSFFSTASGMQSSHPDSTDVQVSAASLSSLASFGFSRDGSSLPVKRGVGFDPSVEVVAYKGTSKASALRDKGRTFETSFERPVEIPKTWSFSSMSSMSSIFSQDGYVSAPPTSMAGPRLQPVREEDLPDTMPALDFPWGSQRWIPQLH